MKKYLLPPKTLRLWQIRVAAAGLLVIAVFLYLTKFANGFWIGVVAAALVCAVVLFWYLPRFFKSCECRLINDTVIVERGVFIKNTHIFPFSRLIYTQTFTSPLSSLMGLTCVSLKAARKRLYFPEMCVEDSEALIKKLSGGRADES